MFRGPVFILPGLTLFDLTVDFVGLYMHIGCLSESCGLGSCPAAFY